jgi:predicted Abi (CAAX) family protease
MPETVAPLTYERNDGGDTAGYISKNWPAGTRSIVVHLFGWRKNTITGESGSQALGIVTGHFAFGVACVVIDPFTGEKRFDIEYKQVYAHNNSAIISGAHKWHSYMGDLKRGWMYTIPVSDTIIQLPELMPYDIGGWKIDPLKGFSRVTEMMTAVYRTGAGGGVAMVRPDISCVQDSHYALYAALMVFENSILGSPKAAEWIKNNPQNESVKRFNSLISLTRQLKDRTTILGIARKDWRAHFSNPLGTRDPGKAEQVIRALLSIKSVFPRDGNDNLLNLAADRGVRMWSILTAMSGGKVEGLWPITPTSLINR